MRFSSGCDIAGREADRSSLSNAEVKNTWGCTSSFHKSYDMLFNYAKENFTIYTERNNSLSLHKPKVQQAKDTILLKFYSPSFSCDQS
jgi:hypothetical protein